MAVPMDLLIHLSDQLDSREVNEIKFFVSDGFGLRKQELEGAECGFHVFNLLQKNGFIHDSNLSLLRNIFGYMGREDLKRKVAHINHGENYDVSSLYKLLFEVDKGLQRRDRETLVCCFEDKIADSSLCERSKKSDSALRVFSHLKNKFKSIEEYLAKLHHYLDEVLNHKKLASKVEQRMQGVLSDIDQENKNRNDNLYTFDNIKQTKTDPSMLGGFGAEVREAVGASLQVVDALPTRTYQSEFTNPDRLTEEVWEPLSKLRLDPQPLIGASSLHPSINEPRGLRGGTVTPRQQRLGDRQRGDYTDYSPEMGQPRSQQRPAASPANDGYEQSLSTSPNTLFSSLLLKTNSPSSFAPSNGSALSVGPCTGSSTPYLPHREPDTYRYVTTPNTGSTQPPQSSYPSSSFSDPNTGSTQPPQSSYPSSSLSDPNTGSTQPPQSSYPSPPLSDPNTGSTQPPQSSYPSPSLSDPNTGSTQPPQSSYPSPSLSDPNTGSTQPPPSLSDPNTGSTQPPQSSYPSPSLSDPNTGSTQPPQSSYPSPSLSDPNTGSTQPPQSSYPSPSLSDPNTGSTQPPQSSYPSPSLSDPNTGSTQPPQSGYPSPSLSDPNTGSTQPPQSSYSSPSLSDPNTGSTQPPQSSYPSPSLSDPNTGSTQPPQSSYPSPSLSDPNTGSTPLPTVSSNTLASLSDPNTGSTQPPQSSNPSLSLSDLNTGFTPPPISSECSVSNSVSDPDVSTIPPHVLNFNQSPLQTSNNSSTSASEPSSSAISTSDMSFSLPSPPKSPRILGSLDEELGVPAPLVGIKGAYFYNYTNENDFEHDIGINKEEEKLGKGGFGDVYKGKYKFGGIDVAVKTEDPQAQHSKQGDEEDRKKQFKRENDSAFIKHPYVLPILAVCKEPIRIVYPYMKNKDLDSVLESATEPIARIIRVRITYQICEALQHLQSNNPCKKKIVHRDVKAANILLDPSFNARLGDMGLSLVIEENKTHITVSKKAGTSGYLDPDTSHRPYRPLHDLYSVGMIMYRLLTEKPVEDMREVLDNYEDHREGDTDELEFYKKEIKKELKKGIWKNDANTDAYITAAAKCFLIPRERIKLSDLCQTFKDIIRGEKHTMYVDKFYKDRCVACLANPRVNVSLCWGSECYFYCRDCLVKKEMNPVFCPSHGVPDAQPIGSKNWHVLAIGGYPKITDDARIFHRDASRFANTLLDPRICGVRKDNLRLLSIEKDEVFTKKDVFDALKEITEKMNKDENTNQRKRLFFYFSGHSTKQGNLLLNPHTKDTVTAENIKDVLKNLVKTDILVFLDTCYASKHSLCDQGLLHPKERDSSTVFQFSSSSQALPTTYNRKEYNSPFTCAVLNALRGCSPCKCVDCNKLQKDIKEKMFVELNEMKAFICHSFRDEPQCRPTFKGEHYGDVVPMAYFCGEVLDYLVCYEDKVDPKDVVFRNVYLSANEVQSTNEAQGAYDDLKIFIGQVLENYQRDYGVPPDQFLAPSRYELWFNNRPIKDLDDLKEVYGINGKVEMRFCGSFT